MYVNLVVVLEEGPGGHQSFKGTTSGNIECLYKVW